MQQSTTRRTLHYYWQVTRKHKGLFWGLTYRHFFSWRCFRMATRTL